MSDEKPDKYERKLVTLTDGEIVSVKKSSRRKMLASMGVGVAAAGAALLSSARAAKSSDPKQFETDKKPPKIDPDRD